MCLELVYHEEKTELGRQQAPGVCPYCGGKVSAVDIETKWLFCFLPLCFKVKRKYSCSSCDRRLVLYYWKKQSSRWRKKQRRIELLSNSLLSMLMFLHIFFVLSELLLTPLMVVTLVEFIEFLFNVNNLVGPISFVKPVEFSFV